MQHPSYVYIIPVKTVGWHDPLPSRVEQLHRDLLIWPERGNHGLGEMGFTWHIVWSTVQYLRDLIPFAHYIVHSVLTTHICCKSPATRYCIPSPHLTRNYHPHMHKSWLTGLIVCHSLVDSYYHRRLFPCSDSRNFLFDKKLTVSNEGGVWACSVLLSWTLTLPVLLQS